MKIDVLKLHFKSPVHWSLGKAESYESSGDVLHSDTIKSALFAAGLQLFGDELFEIDFYSQFRVSSAFPFVGDSYFLPKPLSYHPKVSPAERKKVKRINYLRSDYFEKVLQGDLSIQTEQLVDDHTYKIWEKENTQRVAIDRITHAGVPFYLEKLFPVDPENRGLYFMISGNAKSESDLMDRLQTIANYLGDSGLGLQRSVGNGSFTAELDALELNLPESPCNAGVSLSLYRPLIDEINEVMLESGYYDFTIRGGWMASPEKAEHRSYRKRSVYMFKEGSIFMFPHNDMALVHRGEGQIDLKPDNNKLPSEINHEVWRDGTGLFLPISLKD